MNMTYITNKQRATFALSAITHYYQLKEGKTEVDDDASTVLSDFLADLRHYAANASINYDETDKQAQSAYEDEVIEFQMELNQYLPDFIKALSKARDELTFQQKHFPRADDTELREALLTVTRMLAIAAGEQP
jgi:hypothetical protein